MSDNPDDRCYHGNTPLEGCSLCEEEKAPSSEMERLLAGSLAIAELAALRKKLSVYGKWLEVQADDCFAQATVKSSVVVKYRWRARGTSYHTSANKLRELLETK
jgi:hypothetical protein